MISIKLRINLTLNDLDGEESTNETKSNCPVFCHCNFFFWFQKPFLFLVAISEHLLVQYLTKRQNRSASDFKYFFWFPRKIFPLFFPLPSSTYLGGKWGRTRIRQNVHRTSVRIQLFLKRKRFRLTNGNARNECRTFSGWNDFVSDWFNEWIF
jgi:hypothetical protein